MDRAKNVFFVVSTHDQNFTAKERHIDMPYFKLHAVFQVVRSPTPYNEYLVVRALFVNSDYHVECVIYGLTVLPSGKFLGLTRSKGHTFVKLYLIIDSD